MARVLAALLVLAGLAIPEENPQQELLEMAGIGGDRESVTTYLRSLRPTAEERARIDGLIRKLSSAERAERDSAARELSDRGAGAQEAFRRVLQHPDPEVRRLARGLLENAERKAQPSLLFAALRVIELQSFPGLKSEVLAVLDGTETDRLALVAQRALRATSTAGDRPALEELAARGSRVSVRAAAVFALARLLGADDRTRIMGACLEDGEDRVRLAAAWALADLRDRRGLAVLGDLLDSDDPFVRHHGAAILRQISGTRFGYMSGGGKRERAGATAAWKRWIEEKGPAAVWSAPLRLRRPYLGRTLLTLYQQGRVIELDEDRKQVWEIKALKRPWACCGLPSGNRLIADYQTREVHEFDSSGTEVWRSGPLPMAAIGLQRLENGNTLVVSYARKGSLLEVRPDRTVAWKLELDGMPFAAQRLENGRTLVLFYKPSKVVEMDRSGKVLWELVPDGQARSVERLENGDTLVCDRNGSRLAEYTRDGKIAWSLPGLKVCRYATRLPNGNTILVDVNGIREIERSGKTVWTHSIKRTSFGICHY